jgi:branched-chain amino acid transport system permease protein
VNLTTLGIGIATGIALGGVYSLIGLGFTLVVASTRLFLFVFESVVSLGGVLAFFFLDDEHWSIGAAVALVCLVGGIAGLLLDLLVHRPLIGRVRDMSIAVLVATIGLSIAADALLSLLFGPNPRQVEAYASPRPFIIATIPIQWSFVVIVAVLVLIAISFGWALRHTSIGHQLIALEQDSEGAQLLGIRVSRLTTGVFALAGVLSALAGFLITPIADASASTGSSLIIPAFAAMAAGGFGSFSGAIAGGMLIGLVEGIVPLYANVNAVNPILLGIIVVVLLVRPVGMFGRPELLREY